MTCEELREEYGAYGLGAADEPERSEISAHLMRGCGECTGGVRIAMSTAAALALGVEEADPPRRLRKRVMALVAPDSSRAWIAALVPWGIAAALGAALVFRIVPHPAAQPDDRLAQTLSILDDPAAKDVSFGQPTARGRVFVSEGRGVVFIGAAMPKLEPGKTFELWVIPRTGNPIPAGTFEGAKDSTALYVRPGPVPNAAAVAVTVEPAGGSPQPTTKPFIVTKL